jgi:hypothetical protein
MNRMQELSALEQLRLRRKVQPSEIARHLLDYALAHIKGNKVLDEGNGGLALPGDDE